MEPVLISYLGIPVLPVYCPALGQFCQGITLGYLDDQKSLTDIYNHHLLLNKIQIAVIGSGSKCFNFDDYFMAGVSIIISSNQRMTTIVSNSLFKGFHSTAVHIRSHCPTFKSTFELNSCIFYSMNKAVVQAVLSNFNNVFSLNNCSFQGNNGDEFVILIYTGGIDDFTC